MKVKILIFMGILVLLAMPFSRAATAQQVRTPQPAAAPRTAKGSGVYLSERSMTTRLKSQNVELIGQIGGPVYAVDVQGDYAYIGVGPRLMVLAISSPDAPTVDGSTDVLPGIVRDVVVSGN